MNLDRRALLVLMYIVLGLVGLIILLPIIDFAFMKDGFRGILIVFSLFLSSWAITDFVLRK